MTIKLSGELVTDCDLNDDLITQPRSTWEHRHNAALRELLALRLEGDALKARLATPSDHQHALSMLCNLCRTGQDASKEYDAVLALLLERDALERDAWRWRRFIDSYYEVSTNVERWGGVRRLVIDKAELTTRIDSAISAAKVADK